MNTLQIVIHCLPREIDQLERILDKLHESSFFLDKKDQVILDITLNLNDIFTDWDKSILDKIFFKTKFDHLKSKSSWAYKLLFNIDENNQCLGINDKRRNSINNIDDEVDYIMYLDLDLFFSKINLPIAFQSFEQLNSQYQIISSELTKLWDSSWDIISNNMFKTESYDFWKSIDPYSIEYYVTNNEFNIKPINTIKFGGGWFNIFSVNLLKLIGIPDSLGPYGLDDTFIMEASKLMKSKGYDINQYILEGALVCENIKYGLYDFNPYKNYIKDLSIEDNGKVFKQTFRDNALKNFTTELQEFYNNI